MFRFTIRDLLWLMVVAGMGVGWAADHERLTGRYWLRPRQLNAAQSKFAKDDYPAAFYFREIHIMNSWSMNKGELGKAVVEEWKKVTFA